MYVFLKDMNIITLVFMCSIYFLSGTFLPQVLEYTLLKFILIKAFFKISCDIKNIYYYLKRNNCNGYSIRKDRRIETIT